MCAAAKKSLPNVKNVGLVFVLGIVGLAKATVICAESSVTLGEIMKALKIMLIGIWFLGMIYAIFKFPTITILILVVTIFIWMMWNDIKKSNMPSE